MDKSKKLQFCAMTQNKLLHAMKRAVCTVALCALTLISASAEAVSFGDNGSSYEISDATATVTLAASGDWATLISGNSSALPSDFDGVTKVVFQGSDVLFNALDASYAGKLINGTIAFVDMSALDSVDISTASSTGGTCWNGYYSTSITNGVYPSVLLPSGYDAESFAAINNYAYDNSIAHHTAFFSFTDESKTAVCAAGVDFSYLASIKTDATKTLYISGFGGYGVSSSATYLATADIAGIDNIVLKEHSDGTTLSNVGESYMPADGFTNTKCLILTQDGQWSSRDITAWSVHGSLDLVGWVNYSGVLQAKFLQTGVAANLVLPETETYESAAYYGTLNSADMAYFANAKHVSMSLYGITYSSTGDDDTFVTATKDWELNDMLEYLLLPDLQSEATDPYLENFIVNGQSRTISSTDADGNETTTTPNPSLKAVAYYDTGTDDGASSQRNKFYIAQTMPGGLEIINGLFPTTYYLTNTVKPNELSVAGYFNATDLACYVEGNARALDDNGHLKLSETATPVYNGDLSYEYYSSAKAASNDDRWQSPFSGVTSLDLSKGLLTIKTEQSNQTEYEAELEAAQYDVDISQMGFGSNLTSVEFPRDPNFYYIPPRCLGIDGATIPSLCLPSNITRIGAGAFGAGSFRVIYAEVEAAGGESIYDDITLTDGETVYMIDGLPFKKSELATILATDDSGNIAAVSRTSSNYAYTVFDGITYATSGMAELQEGSYFEEEEVSVTLPPNLEHIEKGAFWAILPYDVFVLNSNKVATCEPWSFQVCTLNGNNGYTADDPISKNNYSGNGNRMALLHYPTGLSTEDIKLYKDITRVYSHADGLLATDDEGSVLLWPTQTEWVASFGQATTGYLWDGWSDKDGATSVNPSVVNWYTTEQLNEDESLMTAVGAKKISAENDNVNTFAPLAEDGSGFEQEETYIGWHQFVLAYGYDPVEATPKQTFYISDNNWWTICSPFSMTKKFIQTYFGENARVCTLQDVQRFDVDGTYTHTDDANKTVTADMAAGSIVLGFGEDLMASAADDGTVIEAQKPYMIRPNKKFDSDTSVTLELTSSQAAQRDLAESTYAANKFTTLIHSKKTQATTGDEENATKTVSDELTYVFIGSLGAAYYIPQNSYFLGWDSENSKVAYYYQSASPTVRNWNTYTCVVMPVTDSGDDDGGATYSPDGNIAWFHSADKDAESAHWISDTSGGGATSTAGTFICGIDDSLGSGSGDTGDGGGSSKTASLYFDVAGDLTAIDHITAEGSFVEAVSGAVYSLSGIKVADSFNANALPKGIYIVGGKKVAVK